MKKYILKISGEALRDNNVLSENKAKKVCNDIKKFVDTSSCLAVITGAGNIWRGRNSKIIDDVDADYIGMQATNLNASLLYYMLKNMGIRSYLCSALPIDNVINSYEIDRVNELYNAGYVIIIGGGLGQPGITTDTAIAKRSIELDADVILMGKSIDAVYDKDPKISGAYRYEKISMTELIENQKKVGLNSPGIIDMEAALLLKDTNKEIYIYKGDSITAIDEILSGKNPGTIIKNN